MLLILWTNIPEEKLFLRYSVALCIFCVVTRQSQGTGMDATAAFEDNLHSEEARAMLSKYYIGELEESAKR